MLTLSWLVAGFHFLALGIGLGAVFARGRCLSALRDNAQRAAQSAPLKPLFMADNFWGLAALVWIGSGLWRAFGGLEKGGDYYLHNYLFHAKMGLFLLIFLLEIPIMVTLIQWRLMLKKEGEVSTLDRARWMLKANHVELMMTLIIPFLASAMSHGIGNYGR